MEAERLRDEEESFKRPKGATRPREDADPDLLSGMIATVTPILPLKQMPASPTANRNRSPEDLRRRGRRLRPYGAGGAVVRVSAEVRLPSYPRPAGE